MIIFKLKGRKSRSCEVIFMKKKNFIQDIEILSKIHMYKFPISTKINSFIISFKRHL